MSHYAACSCDSQWLSVFVPRTVSQLEPDGPFVTVTLWKVICASHFAFSPVTQWQHFNKMHPFYFDRDKNGKKANTHTCCVSCTCSMILLMHLVLSHRALGRFLFDYQNTTYTDTAPWILDAPCFATLWPAAIKHHPGRPQVHWDKDTTCGV